MDLKTKLQELIKTSPTLQSLPAEELKFRAEAMLSADEESMAAFVKILEDEAAQMKKIDEDYEKKSGEINDLLTEAKALEQEAEGMIRKEKEDSERGDEEQQAEDLLKKLDDVQ